MRLRCDLHIHTVLSPCGDMDMTPNNIVNMAQLKGLDVLAITDHNAVANAAAVMECAKDTPLIVLPGMELETAENTHLICLFEHLVQANEFYEWLAGYFVPVENRPEIFGEQVMMNSADEIIAHESRLLVTATTCSLYDAVPQVERLGGVIYPAHVDRDSYSVISNLGFVPPDLGFRTVEISRRTTQDEALSLFPHLTQYQTITASDAHHLWDIYEDECSLEVSNRSAEAVLDYLKGKKL